MVFPAVRSAASLVLLLTLSTSLASAADAAPASSQATPLFNGRDLSGWKVFSPDMAGARDTWSVADGVLRCSGDPAGYVRTEARYSDFELTVEWRWTGPAPVGDDGKPRSRNSGVLLRMQGQDTIWPKSIEAQLMEGNAGDFYVIGGVETTELVAARERALAAAGNDETARQRAANNRRLPKARESSEKPIGEWNTYTIVCRGGDISLTVNGVPQNQASGVTVREGHLCLQSEGAAIEFRNVQLRPLN